MSSKKTDQSQTKVRKAAMLEALEKSLGIVSTAAKKVGIGRTIHYKWIKEDDEYRKAVEDLENVSLDFAESKLHELINGVKMEGKKGVYQRPPDTAATIFYLKTKGKERGYVERIETKEVKPENLPDWMNEGDDE